MGARMRPLRLGIAWALGLLSLGTAARGSDRETFQERIAPILEARCLRCHGGTATKGGLSLATVEAADRRGVTLEIRSFPESTHTADQAARAVGAQLGQIVKSLVFVSSRGVSASMVPDLASLMRQNP